jgi:hypothetical protein
MLRTSKAIQVDFAELCILDSQHARLIQEASADGDWRKVFRIFAGFCKFNTVQRVLLPLCTSGNQIAVSSGTHWMLAELCLEDKVVCIYDWLPGKFQSDYELIAGVPHRVLFCDSFVCQCLLDMCPVAAPLVHLLDVLQARCHGIMQGEGTSRVQFVKKDIQENGSDCGAWAMYALYTRALKRATRYSRAALFDNMDMKCPRHALNFRYMPLPSLQATHAGHVPHVLLTAAHAFIAMLPAMFHMFCSQQPMSL